MLWLSVRLSVATAAAVALVAGLTPPSLAPVADLTGRAPASPTPSATSSPEHDGRRAASPARPARPPPRPRRAGAGTDEPAAAGRAAVHGRYAGHLSASPRTLSADRPVPRRQRDADRSQLRRHPHPGPGRGRDAGARDRPRATGSVRLLVATDQEGGQVQVLQGRGISTDAVRAHPGPLDPAAARAGRWRVGPAAACGRREHEPRPGRRHRPRPGGGRRTTRPIGAYDREFGYSPGWSPAHGVAFARGLTVPRRACPPSKHFPGLGRVHANTDTRAGSPTGSPGATTPTSRRSAGPSTPACPR